MYTYYYLSFPTNNHEDSLCISIVVGKTIKSKTKNNYVFELYALIQFTISFFFYAAI